MFTLNTYTALITGASGAIGQSAAMTLAKQGASLALSGTRVSILEELSETIFKETGQKPFIFPCSLSHKESVETLIPLVEERLGKIDILINNAGITKDTLLMRMKDDQWDDVLNVNLTAVFRLCRSVIKGMIKRRYGRIVNITSVVALSGNIGQTNYCASKAGMVGFSKALALEVASRGVTVNCIAPGFIDSSMTESLNEEIKEKLLSLIPLGRMGTPEDIAASIAFLASQESAYITGTTLAVNGGMRLD